MRPAGRVYAALLALVMAAAAAPGQIAGGLRDELVTKITALTPAETDEVRRYVEPRLDAIGGEGGAPRERARAELVAALRRPGVSVAFRQAYRGVMLERLSQLAGDAREEIAINAILVLGELADDPAARIVMDRTGDERQTVRYAAVVALSTSFRAVREQSPALTPGLVGRIVEHLGQRLRHEGDAWTADAVARALIAAGSITRAEFAPAAESAWVALAEGVGDRLFDAPRGPERRIAILTAMRAGEALRDALTASSGIGERASRAGAGLGAEMLGFVSMSLADRPATEDRRLDMDLVTVAENVVFFARQRVQTTPPTQTNMAAAVEARQDAEFRNTARRVAVELTQPPISLAQARLLRWFE